LNLLFGAREETFASKKMHFCLQKFNHMLLKEHVVGTVTTPNGVTVASRALRQK
jgi:hypothetical protein